MRWLTILFSEQKSNSKLACNVIFFRKKKFQFVLRRSRTIWEVQIRDYILASVVSLSLPLDNTSFSLPAEEAVKIFDGGYDNKYHTVRTSLFEVRIYSLLII